ncbi:hypothetical protein [Bacillus subtilis]|uniref:hypothetical protein n=1 Tax=Bacillus subtilis TaxID=1423 RepID=UPI0007EB914D|nr:hypothetical protein [Bacillus subtilis]MCZ8480274.1 hypothetical protein [Bacillus subtilis]OAZ70948.1 hypothetical protein SRCM101280_00774 [Bacillus subtilis]
MGNQKFVGYHGTFQNVVDNILDEGFKPKKRINHWLGQGTYFYTEKKLAQWFITRNSKTDREKKKINSPIAIIKAIIEEEDSKVLNLDTTEGVDLFFQCIDDHSETFEKIEFTKNDHINRCIILDILTRLCGFNVIIKTFEASDHQPSYAKVNTSFFDRKIIPLNVHYKETQIRVSDQECIKSTEVEHAIEYKRPKRLYFDDKNQFLG